MKVKFKRLSKNAIVPKKGTDGSAGIDMYISSSSPVKIPAHTTIMLHTDIAMEIPKGYYGALFSRSGIASKRGLRIATGTSVIDSDYRGEIGIPIHNDNDYTESVKPYERVAQLVIMAYPTIELEEAESLDETHRGENGFGSTGI